MYRANLSQQEEQELKQIIKKESNGRVLKRYQCILMNNEGIENITIAKFLGVRNDTITNWVKLYLDSGMKGLSQFDFTGKRKSVLEDVKDQIEIHVKHDTVSSMNELAEWLKDSYDIEVETSWLGRWCKKNSISLLKNQE